MMSIVTGFVLICLGIWGIAAHWYSFLDILRSFVPLLAVLGGIVALVAGIKSTGEGKWRRGWGCCDREGKS